MFRRTFFTIYFINFNFWSICFSKSMPNFWRTVIHKIQYIISFRLEKDSLRLIYISHNRAVEKEVKKLLHVFSFVQRAIGPVVGLKIWGCTLASFRLSNFFDEILLLPKSGGWGALALSPPALFTFALQNMFLTSLWGS